jgi:hypothetical protein
VFRRDPCERASKERTIVVVRLRECFTHEAFEIVERVARIGHERTRRAHSRERLARKDVDAFVCAAHAAFRAAVDCGEGMFGERACEGITRKHGPMLEAPRPQCRNEGARDRRIRYVRSRRAGRAYDLVVCDFGWQGRDVRSRRSAR